MPQACSSAVLPESLEPRGWISFSLARSRTQEPGESNQPGVTVTHCSSPNNYRLVNYTKAQNIRKGARFSPGQ